MDTMVLYLHSKWSLCFFIYSIKLNIYIYDEITLCCASCAAPI